MYACAGRLAEGSALGQSGGGSRDAEGAGIGVGALTSPSKPAALTSPAAAASCPPAPNGAELSVIAIDNTSFTFAAFVGHANNDRRLTLSKLFIGYAKFSL